MCEIVKNTGVRSHGVRATVLRQIASAKEEGSDVPGFMMLGQRVDRNEVWDAWIMEQADREGILKVMNGASQGIINEDFEQVDRKKKAIALKRTKACFQETRTTMKASQLKVERRRFAKAHRHHLKDNVCRWLQVPIGQARQGRRTTWKVKRLLISKGKLVFEPQQFVLCPPDGLLDYSCAPPAALTALRFCSQFCRSLLWSL